MSERFATWIKIGGKIKKSRLKALLKSIHDAGVCLDWGESLFHPKDLSDILPACRDGVLHFCDEESRYGEFPYLEKTCRRLRLSYQRHTEGIGGYDASLIDWRPGMLEPVWRRSSNEHTEETLLLSSEVAAAIMLMERKFIKEAMAKLKELCPDISELPPFEVV